MSSEKRHIDKALVIKLKKGNRIAFHQLYKRYHQDIYAFSISLLKSKSLAEDNLQEVFLKIWDKRKQLDPDASFRSFIFTIARNRAFNNLAKAANNQKLREAVFYQSQKKARSTDRRLLDENYQKLKEEAIAQLTPRCRQVFEMSRNEGKSYQQISEELGVSLQTVKNQMSAALKTIRNFLSKHSDIAFLLVFLMEVYYG